MERDYDLIVIGCGTAGSRAASTAAAEGAKVLAVEGGEELGGLCILRGCMPTKTLLETAHRAHDIRDAGRFGIQVGEPTIDFPAQMERMRQLVARFKRAKVNAIENGGYELRWGRPHFLDPHTIELKGERLSAKVFVLATGSRVRDLPVPVAEGARVVTSDAMFLLEEAPASAVVLGGGAVGLEFAQWLARMGTRVTLAVRSRLFHRFDPEMGEELMQALGEEMEVCIPSSLLRVEAADGKTQVHLRQEDGSEVVREVDLVLNAQGRVPATAGLELAAAGLDPAALDLSAGFQSSVPHIFVAGDATGDRALLHEANLEGTVVGRNAARLARGEPADAVYDPGVPPLSVIFSDPPVATLGLTPLDADARGIAYEAALKRYPEQGRGIVVGARHGFVRLLAEPGGGKLLGCQIIGPRADDLIHIPAAMMRLGGTAGDLYTTPWYHPTLAEAFIEVARKLAQ